MGSALLKDSSLAASIIRGVLIGSDNCVACTAKIRLVGGGKGGGEKLGVDDDDEMIINSTKNFMRTLESAGCSQIDVHFRTPSEPSSNSNARSRWENDVVLNDIVGCVGIPVVVNGDVLTRDEVFYLRDSTNASGAMISRGCFVDLPGVFGWEKKVDYMDFVREYVKECVKWKIDFAECKYVVIEIVTMRRVGGRDGVSKGDKVEIMGCKGYGDFRRVFNF